MRSTSWGLMQTTLTFSVVIPAYNAGASIARALDSVRAQSYAACDVLVTNDGSTDETEQILSTYMGRYPQFQLSVSSQENRGIGAARNNGILRAAGQYVAFLDADDIWYREKLERVAFYLEKHPEADLVCHDEYWVEDGKIPKKVEYGPYTSFEDLLFKGNTISTSATVVRRSKLLSAGLFSEKLTFNGVEDYELWMRISRIAAIAYLHEALGEYHVRGSGITRHARLHTRNSISVLKYAFDQWQPQSRRYRYLLRMRMLRLVTAASLQSLRKRNPAEAFVMMIEGSMKAFGR